MIKLVQNVAINEKQNIHMRTYLPIIHFKNIRHVLYVFSYTQKCQSEIRLVKSVVLNIQPVPSNKVMSLCYIFMKLANYIYNVCFEVCI